MENEYYSCVKNFRSLEKGDVVFLGDQPDARISNLTRRLTLAANHPSQRKYAFPEGYLSFCELPDYYFDLNNQWLRTGRSRYWSTEPNHSYLFRNTFLIKDIYQRQIEVRQISRLFPSLDDKDKLAISALVFETATGVAKSFSIKKAPEIFESFLPRLPVTKLKQLLGCLNTPTVTLGGA